MNAATPLRKEECPRTDLRVQGPRGTHKYGAPLLLQLKQGLISMGAPLLFFPPMNFYFFEETYGSSSILLSEAPYFRILE